ncbi:unnamed protein product [Effrenium voratum]|uniref:Uncharacterized protein n=1 Tax=Effrenium voratum TaxID=2562239 RepID=A0AA36NKX6_9DINO|nr:unnamed protein product [Effrenium voratum]CAJ1425197.1 unnamed protein product [Effrenium voratum]
MVASTLSPPKVRRCPQPSTVKRPLKRAASAAAKAPSPTPATPPSTPPRSNRALAARLEEAAAYGAAGQFVDSAEVCSRCAAGALRGARRAKPPDAALAAALGAAAAAAAAAGRKTTVAQVAAAALCALDRVFG